MAISYKSTIPEYKEYVSQLPVELILKAGMHKQNQFDQNYAKIQSNLNQLASMDVMKDQDRQYLSQRLNGTLQELNKLGGVDLADNNIVSQINGYASNIVDDKVMNAVLSTGRARALINDQKEMKEKHPGLYPIQNEDYDTQGLRDWLNDGQVGSKYGGGQVTPYTDYNKDIEEQLKGLKENKQTRFRPGSNQLEYYVDKEGWVSEDRVKEVIKGNLMPQHLQQMQIDSKYQFKGYTPEQIYDVAAQEHIKAINYAEQQINNTQKIIDGNPNDLTKIAEARSEQLKWGEYKKKYEDDLVTLRENTYKNPQGVAFESFKDGYIRGKQFEHSYHQVETEIKIHEGLKFQLEQQQRWDIAIMNNKIDQAKLGLDQAKLQLEYRKEGLDLSTGLPTRVVAPAGTDDVTTYTEDQIKGDIKTQDVALTKLNDDKATIDDKLNSEQYALLDKLPSSYYTIETAVVNGPDGKPISKQIKKPNSKFWNYLEYQESRNAWLKANPNSDPDVLFGDASDEMFKNYKNNVVKAQNARQLNVKYLEDVDKRADALANGKGIMTSEQLNREEASIFNSIPNEITLSSYSDKGKIKISKTDIIKFLRDPNDKTIDNTKKEALSESYSNSQFFNSASGLYLGAPFKMQGDKIREWVTKYNALANGKTKELIELKKNIIAQDGQRNQPIMQGATKSMNDNQNLTNSVGVFVNQKLTEAGLTNQLADPTSIKIVASSGPQRAVTVSYNPVGTSGEKERITQTFRDTNNELQDAGVLFGTNVKADPLYNSAKRIGYTDKNPGSILTTKSGDLSYYVMINNNGTSNENYSIFVPTGAWDGKTWSQEIYLNTVNDWGDIETAMENFEAKTYLSMPVDQRKKEILIDKISKKYQKK